MRPSLGAAGLRSVISRSPAGRAFGVWRMAFGLNRNQSSPANSGDHFKRHTLQSVSVAAALKPYAIRHTPYALRVSRHPLPMGPQQ